MAGYNSVVRTLIHSRWMVIWTRGEEEREKLRIKVGTMFYTGKAIEGPDRNMLLIASAEG